MNGAPLARWRLTLTGRVQGVGFRPCVHGLARRHGLAGSVRNAGAALVIEVEGRAAALERFAEDLRREAPAAAAGFSSTRSMLAPAGAHGFAILASGPDGDGDVPPDAATCTECLRELRDPTDRRHGYAFTHCAHCGPRFSVLAAMPFDRERTTLADFTPCADCAREYADPADRRFHAQGICCPACGPRLSLVDAAGRPLAESGDAVATAVALLRADRVLAVKATGGFQLWVRAGSAAAVAQLRERKRRPHKPFALMLPDVTAVAALCALDATEARELGGPAAPILLLAPRPDARPGIAANVAPGVPALGVMLPSSPLQTLLIDALGEPVVATSGNLAGEPICIDDAEARARLGGVADAFLGHDRRILRALDDPVARVVEGRLQVLRVGRGLAPLVLPLPAALPPALALGGDLKAAVAVTTPRGIALGQHLGDLGQRASQRALAAAREDYTPLMATAATPRVLRDSHPDCVASTLEPTAQGVPHHLAHAAACLAEHGPALAPSFLAFTWDGSGFGADGSLWGGECLRLDVDGPRVAGWTRVASLRPIGLPGGEAAIRDPRRVAVALLAEAGLDTDLCAEAPTWRRQLERGLNAPFASSVGRLFDGVAALLMLHAGRWSPPSYEGQLALGLEALAGGVDDPDLAPYPLPLAVAAAPPQLDWRPLVRATWFDLARGRPPAAIARAFHLALVDGMAATLAALGEDPAAPRVALCGGVFQNRLLLGLAAARLRSAGHRVCWPRRVPINDGGLAVGQLLAACDHEAVPQAE